MGAAEVLLLMQLVLFSIMSISSTPRGVQSVMFAFRNNCSYTIWPATLSGAGSPMLPSTGFQLSSGATVSMGVPTPWSGRIWGRTLCESNSQPPPSGRCGTGDCGSGMMQCNGRGVIPPTTLAEFTLSGYKNQDFYDISLVDGFNTPISIVPQGKSGACPTTSCPADVNAQCPKELALQSTDGKGAIGCKSACSALNQPKYCCTGNFSTPQTCPQTTESQYFKKQCPQAYSYAYDDTTSTFTCPTGVNYLITFCP